RPRPSVFCPQPTPKGSKVIGHTNLNLSGAVAQYGRGVGIIQATSAQLMNQFAKALREKFAPSGTLPAGTPATQAPPAQPTPASGSPAESVSPSPVGAKPIGGFSLLAKAAWNWFIGLFKRS